MTNPDDPAFYDESYMSSGGHVHDRGYRNLTKREYFAAMAMQGMAAANPVASTEEVSRISCALADALIAELNKPHD